MFLKTERPLESEMSLYREIIKSSLVKPKPISSGLNLPKFSSEVSQKGLNCSENMNIPVKIEENERENTFVISNLCSFNSYDRCVSLWFLIMCPSIKISLHIHQFKMYYNINEHQIIEILSLSHQSSVLLTSYSSSRTNSEIIFGFFFGELRPYLWKAHLFRF